MECHQVRLSNLILNIFFSIFFFHEMPSAEEAYEFQLQSRSFSCEEEQKDIRFDLT